MVGMERVVRKLRMVRLERMVWTERYLGI